MREPPLHRFEHGLDQGFRIGPGVEHIGGETEVQTPELTEAEDARHRFTREATLQECFEAGRSLGVQGQIGIADRDRAVEARRRA